MKIYCIKDILNANIGKGRTKLMKNLVSLETVHTHTHTHTHTDSFYLGKKNNLIYSKRRITKNLCDSIFGSCQNIGYF